MDDKSKIEVVNQHPMKDDDFYQNYYNSQNSMHHPTQKSQQTPQSRDDIQK